MLDRNGFVQTSARGLRAYFVGRELGQPVAVRVEHGQAVALGHAVVAPQAEEQLPLLLRLDQPVDGAEPPLLHLARLLSALQVYGPEQEQHQDHDSRGHPPGGQPEIPIREGYVAVAQSATALEDADTMALRAVVRGERRGQHREGIFPFHGFRRDVEPTAPDAAAQIEKPHLQALAVRGEPQPLVGVRGTNAFLPVRILLHRQDRAFLLAQGAYDVRGVAPHQAHWSAGVEEKVEDGIQQAAQQQHEQDLGEQRQRALHLRSCPGLGSDFRFETANDVVSRFLGGDAIVDAP